jgi:nitroreductase
MSVEYRDALVADGTSAPNVAIAVGKAHAQIMSAAVVVIICVDPSEMDTYPDTKRQDAEMLMALQSAANAGTTLLLAAHAEGLGAVWNCAPLFAPAAVTHALDLPTTWQPQAMILIGVPSGTPTTRGRRALSEVAIFK